MTVEQVTIKTGRWALFILLDGKIAWTIDGQYHVATCEEFEVMLRTMFKPRPQKTE